MRVFYKLRGLLMVPPMVFVTFCTWAEVENDLIVFPLGGAVFLLGLALRVWAQMHLRYRLSTGKVLTVTGPYAYVRNPIYLANTVMLVGACMLAELFWFVPIQLLYCAAVYTLVVRHEEAHLTAKYGSAYLEYVRQVPRWLPRTRPGSVRQDTGGTKFLLPSILVEVHNLLLLLPFVIKEILAH